MKSIQEINERIRAGRAVVMTASEVKDLSAEKGVRHVSETVDVVTTATFSPMCSSGAFINVGHTDPGLKMEKVSLDGVPAYGGIAAVDLYIGAAERHPENERFGGAHVICRLVEGEKVLLRAEGRPTDCYPGSRIEGYIDLNTVNQAYLYNPRNCYQNYNAAVNSSNQVLKTYLGVLSPRCASIHFAGSGEISPLFNDPWLRTVGIGTPVFCGGGIGHVAWEGTQYNADAERDPQTGIPLIPAATLAISADLRSLDRRFIRPLLVPGYGVTLSLGIGLAIPVLDEEMAGSVSVRNHQISTRIVDYAGGGEIGRIDYGRLMENRVVWQGRPIPARTLSDRRGAGKICEELKEWVVSGRFPLREAVRPLPIWGHLKKFGPR